MKIQYGVLVEDSIVDTKGYIYRVTWFDTLQTAYSAWLKGNMRGRIIKSVNVIVTETR